MRAENIPRRTLLAGALAACATPASAAVRPRRIVSLNSCLDYMLVELVDRDQIAALSHFARQPQSSPIADLARTLPFTWGSAEEVIALRPDLVLSSRMGGFSAYNSLKRLDIRQGQFSALQTVDENLAQVMEIATLVGWPERGRRLVARIRAALEAARPPSGSRPIRTLVYQANGFSPGPQTLLSEVMGIAGFENVAGRYGLKSWGTVPLERLIADPPELLLVGDASSEARSWADRVMTHPALKSLEGRMRQGRLAENLVYCGGPILIPLAQALTRARLAARTRA
jgi:iron complex transport system substrate-binding protein